MDRMEKWKFYLRKINWLNIWKISGRDLKGISDDNSDACRSKFDILKHLL